MVVCCPAVTDEGFFYLPHDKPASAPLPCLPAGWSKAVSKGTGATYFLHTDGASQFDMPSEPAEEAESTELLESKLANRTSPSTTPKNKAEAATTGAPSFTSPSVAVSNIEKASVADATIFRLPEANKLPVG